MDMLEEYFNRHKKQGLSTLKLDFKPLLNTHWDAYCERFGFGWKQEELIEEFIENAVNEEKQMEIKENKFKKGQKVRDVEYGNIYTVTDIDSYDFIINTYWYGLKDDKTQFIYSRPEQELEAYVEERKSDKKENQNGN